MHRFLPDLLQRECPSTSYMDMLLIYFHSSNMKTRTKRITHCAHPEFPFIATATAYIFSPVAVFAPYPMNLSIYVQYIPDIQTYVCMAYIRTHFIYIIYNRYTQSIVSIDLILAPYTLLWMMSACNTRFGIEQLVMIVEPSGTGGFPLHWHQCESTFMNGYCDKTYHIGIVIQNWLQ